MEKSKKSKKSKKKKIIIISIIAVVVIIGAVLILKAVLSPKTDSASADSGVQAAALQKQDMSTYVSATGTVESQNVVSVTTDLQCKVKTLNVALGDYVEAGQVLCTFDDTEIKSQISTLEKQVTASQAQAAKQSEIAKRQLSNAKLNQTISLNKKTAEIAEITSQLNTAKTKYAAQTDDTAKAELASSISELQAQLNTANAEYAELQQSTAEAIQTAQDEVDESALSTTDSDTAKELAKLYLQLDGVTVKAEQSGIITSLNISQGSIPNGTLMVISDNQNLQVTVSIGESDIKKLSKDMKAVITTDALEGQDIKGIVSRVIDFATGSASSASYSEEGESSGSSSNGYSAVIKVDSGSGLLLGMSVKVEIIVKEGKEETAVAYDSIATDENGNTYVYKANDLGNGKYKVVKANVKVKDESDYYTAITSDDLKIGDMIISYPDSVSEGDVIKVADTEGVISEDLASSDMAY